MKIKHIILVGGGHTHVLFLKRYNTHPIPNTHLTVIEPQKNVPYTGMLPGYIAGHYTQDELYISIQALCDHDQISFIQDRVVSADSDTNTLVLSSQEELTYDYISYDVGIHARLNTMPGFEQYATAVKPLGDFARSWSHFVAQENLRKDVLIIGGGIAALETACAMDYALRTRKADYQITIVEREDLLSQASPSTRRYLTQELTSRGISIHTRTSVARIDKQSVLLNDGGTVETNFVLSAAGAQPYTWISSTGLECYGGYIVVNKFLQSTSHANVFAVGDCAHFSPYPLDKAGVYAVRQAPVLYHNIKAIIESKSLQEFVPQRDYLKLISLGGKTAAAEKWGLCIRGRLLWQLKNYIDKKFMKQFTN